MALSSDCVSDACLHSSLLDSRLLLSSRPQDRNCESTHKDEKRWLSRNHSENILFWEAPPMPTNELSVHLTVFSSVDLRFRRCLGLFAVVCMHFINFALRYRPSIHRDGRYHAKPVCLCCQHLQH